MNNESESFLKDVGAMYENTDVASQAEVAEANATPIAEVQDSAEIAVDTPANETIPEVKVEPTATEEIPTIQNEPINYWVELEQKTGGLVKDEETFNGIIEKSKNYETILQEKSELEKNQFKPANDYVKGLNDLISGGGSKDQINAFVKLNEYGKLEDLQPIEAKVAKMVLIDGYSEDVARKIVNRNFDLSQFDLEDSEEADKASIMKEELRISAKADLQSLEAYKKDLSVVHNPEKESAEQAKLAEIAQISTYNKAVEQEAPNMVKNFPTKLSFDFKVGDETVKFEDNIDSEFISKELTPLVSDYFKDSLDPVNSETLSQAYSYAHGEYLKANVGKMLERAYVKGNTEGIEKTVNKYENRSGLPRAEENTVIATNSDAMIDFMNKNMLGRS